jgi:hypothetical protein
LCTGFQVTHFFQNDEYILAWQYLLASCDFCFFDVKSLITCHMWVLLE